MRLSIGKISCSARLSQPLRRPGLHQLGVLGCAEGCLGLLAYLVAWLTSPAFATRRRVVGVGIPKPHKTERVVARCDAVIYEYDKR